MFPSIVFYIKFNSCFLKKKLGIFLFYFVYAITKKNPKNKLEKYTIVSFFKIRDYNLE